MPESQHGHEDHYHTGQEKGYQGCQTCSNAHPVIKWEQQLNCISVRHEAAGDLVGTTEASSQAKSTA